MEGRYSNRSYPGTLDRTWLVAISRDPKSTAPLPPETSAALQVGVIRAAVEPSTSEDTKSYNDAVERYEKTTLQWEDRNERSCARMVSTWRMGHVSTFDQRLQHLKCGHFWSVSTRNLIWSLVIWLFGKYADLTPLTSLPLWSTRKT